MDYETNNFTSNISSIDNIYPEETLSDLQTFVQRNEKPISIVFFYGYHCPYSKRIMPKFRQWTRANQDRIVLYEANVEQTTKLAEYYHIRTIPSLIAFHEKNLLVPIWQRTTNNVLSSDMQLEINKSESITDKENIPNYHTQFQEIVREKLNDTKNVFIILDPSLKASNLRFATSDETKREQYLVILDNKYSTETKSNLMKAIIGTINKTRIRV